MKQCPTFCLCNRCEQRRKNIRAAELLNVAENFDKAVKQIHRKAFGALVLKLMIFFLLALGLGSFALMVFS